MRIGKVIGKVTLSKHLDSLKGGRWLVVWPLNRQILSGQPRVPEWSLVCYDNLGAGLGDTIGYVEGHEASLPFETDTPVDACNTMIVDSLNYTPPRKQ
jgi:microcompartment protein CcmK/EutM